MMESPTPMGKQARRTNRLNPNRRWGKCWLSICVFLTVVALIPSAGAANQTIEARVDRNSINFDQTLTLEIRLTMQGHGDVEEYRPPDLGNFEIVRQSTSQHISIVNYDVTKTKVHTYVLRPNRTGPLTLGPAQAQLGGQTYKSDPISVLVRERPQSPTSPGSPTSPPAKPKIPEPKASPTPPHRSGDADTPTDGTSTDPPDQHEVQGDVGLIAQASPQEVYVGQQVLLTYSLATRVDLAEYMADEPSLDGFWFEPIEPATRRPVFRRETISGRRYHVGEVRRYALFPLRPGTMELPPVGFEVAVTSDFFGLSRQRRKGRSNAVVIKVNPLPTKGKPEEFTGAVGSFDLQTTLDRTSVLMGEPVVLTLTLSGSGNFRQFASPTLPPMPDFRVHDPSSQDTLGAEGTHIVGTRRMEILLSPQREGELEIPSISFAFFNPDTKSYQTVRSEPLQLSVGPRDSTRIATPTDGAHSAADRRDQGQPDGMNDHHGHLDDGRSHLPILKPLRLRAQLNPHAKVYAPAYTRLPFLLLVIALPFLYGLGLLMDTLQERQNRNRDRVRMRKACSRAKRRLKEAKDHIADNRPERFFSELSKALNDYLEDRLGAVVGGMTSDSLRVTLEGRGYPPDIVESLVGELENCDFARFAPGSRKQEEMGRALERVQRILNALERTNPVGREKLGSLPKGKVKA